MKTGRVKDASSLYDFIGYVVLYAPDSFPREDYLPESEQMTLGRAFAELHAAVAMVESDLHHASASDLCKLLEQSAQAYRSGEQVKGAHLLQDFQDLVFKPPQ
jgi:hypothetical protein